MKANKLTVIYNPHIVKNHEQLKLIIAASKKLNLKTKLIATDALVSFLNEKTKIRNFSKKILFLDKDIALATFLQKQDYWVYNKALAINYCDNKALTHAALVDTKVKQIKTLLGPILFDNEKMNPASAFIKNIRRTFKYPIVIKDVYGSYGTNVHLVNCEQQAIEIINSTSGRQVIVQEFMKQKIGESVRVFVAGNKIIASIHQKHPTDFRSNLTLGSQGSLINLSKTQQKQAFLINRHLQLFYSGIDFLFDNSGQLIFCEANSNAQLVHVSKTSGKNFVANLLEAIINDQTYYKSLEQNN